MNREQLKLIWYDFKIDLKWYGFLDAVNRACFNIDELKTLPFSEDREKVVDKYIKRKHKISAIKKAWNIK